MPPTMVFNILHRKQETKINDLKRINKNSAGSERTDEVFGSLRLKVGLSFTEFIHAKLKPGSKSASRRKSFCARMSGMKKKLTSSKTANDPNSRINKSLRKWNC